MFFKFYNRLIILFLSSIIFVNTTAWCSQPYELRQHLYYKIEKNGHLIGYAEEYLEPIKTLPNLVVKMWMKTAVGMQFPLPNQPQFTTEEVYEIDLTFDKLIRGEIQYHNLINNQQVNTQVDFNRYKLKQFSIQNTHNQPEKLVARDVIPGYHRFSGLYLEKRIADKAHQGNFSLLLAPMGEIARIKWQILPDTTLSVNGYRLMCHHFLLRHAKDHLLREIWTLKNSARLVQSYEFDSQLMYVLVDERYKNYFEKPFIPNTRKPSLTELSIQFYTTNPDSNWPIISRMQAISLDEIGFPLRNIFPDTIEKYLVPQGDHLKYNSDDLFQIGTTLTKDKHYLDEALLVFTRWCTKEMNLAPIFDKSMISWSEPDWNQYLAGLTLFAQLCRANNLPTRIVEGFYCLSVIKLTCYKWYWIEIFDGKTWFPWHIETPQMPFGGAEFIKKDIVADENLNPLKLEKIENVKLNHYQFERRKVLVD